MTSRSRAFVTAVVVLVAALVAASPGFAQQPATQQPATQQPTLSGGPAASGPQGALQPNPILDRVLARWLILGNQQEIAVNQFAQGRASNDAVKKFAQQMVQDHTQFIDRLQQVPLRNEPGQSGQPGQPGQSSQSGQPQTMVLPPSERVVGTPPTGTTVAPSGTPMQTVPSTGAVSPGQQPYTAGFRGRPEEPPLLTLMQQVGDRTVNLRKDELGKQQGARFDAAYLGQQTAAHLRVLATLQTFQSHATPELQALINQGIQTTERHLDDARNLMNQLEQQAAATARQGAPGTPAPSPQPH